MGFLSKIFKPVSKVLDKIIPNEIKPALPYLAAFAPMLAPGIMGSSVLSRAAMGGGLNIFGQLAQEGNEGDINMLSAGLGALSGAMSAPGKSATVGQGVPGADFTGADFGFEVAANTPASVGTPSASQFFKNFSAGGEGSGIMASGQRFLGDTLAKGSEMYAAGIADPFSKAGLKAALLPGATATGDLMFAQAKRDQDAYEDSQAADSEGDAASDARRAAAIRQSMEAYGFTDDEIEDAIYAAGYKTGGRVGYAFGDFVKGSGVAQPVSASMGSGDRPMMSGSGMGGMLSNMINNNPQLFSSLTSKKDNSFSNMSRDFIDLNENGIDDRQEKAIGGRVGLEFGGSTGELLEMFKERITDGPFKGEEGYIEEGIDMEEFKNSEPMEVESEETEEGYKIKDQPVFLLPMKTGGRVGLRFGGIGAALENIQNDEMKDTAQFVAAMNDMDIPIMDIVEDFEIQFKRKPDSLEELKKYYKEKYDYKGPADTRIKETIEESFRKTAAEGGLMNLDGKEMDMRGGGFIPIGKKERADDVPARLSKNEFVMTADAVRAAGGGSVNEGAKRMYETMNRLEAKA